MVMRQYELGEIALAVNQELQVCPTSSKSISSLNWTENNYCLTGWWVLASEINQCGNTLQQDCDYRGSIYPNTCQICLKMAASREHWLILCLNPSVEKGTSY